MMASRITIGYRYWYVQRAEMIETILQEFNE